MRKKLFAVLACVLSVMMLLSACAGIDIKLTFKVDGKTYATVKTTGKDAIKMPKDPVKEGFVFDGWYWDKDVWEKPFTVNSFLDTPLTESMTVYAKWLKEAEEHIHSFGEWTVETAATCIAEGTEKRVCSVCETAETRVIAKLAHTYEAKYDITNHWKECAVCHEEINKAAHSYGEWTEVTPSTCTAEGTEKRVCECGAEEISTIALKAHDYITKFDEESHWSECSVCEKKKDVAPHAYANGACTICGNSLPTEGFEYNKVNGGYEVVGIGTAEGGNIVIPSTYGGEPVIGIGMAAFQDCSGLESVVIPDSVTNIGDFAFYGCSSLKSVVLPDSVTSIGEGAFYECGGLMSVIIPNSVTSIGSYVFSFCVSLASVEIPNSVTSIGVGVFAFCSSIETITVAEGNTKYHSAGNCLIETETKTLMAGCKNSIIPTDGSVTSIGAWAFYGCSGLVSIKIPDGVTSIGCETFSGCISLERIELPNSVTSIDSAAFSYCSSLVSVVIPDSVTSIGSDAFYNCISLVSVEIPRSVTSIGDFAFSRCGSLINVVIPDSVTSIGEGAFSECGSSRKRSDPE